MSRPGRKKKLEDESVRDLAAIPHIKSEGSIYKAKDKVEPRPQKSSKLELPPIESFKLALKKAKVTEKTIAECIGELIRAEKITVDRRTGKITAAPDHRIRLATVEMLLKYFVPEEKASNNHLHLHGKKLDELLNK